MVEPNSSLAQSLRYSRLVKTRLPPVVAGGWWCSQAVEVESKKRVAVDINTRTSSQPTQPSPAQHQAVSPPHSHTRPADLHTVHPAPSHRAQPPLGIVGQLQRINPALATTQFIQYSISQFQYNSNIRQIVPACMCAWCPVPTMCSSGGLHAAVLTCWPAPATSHQPPSC